MRLLYPVIFTTAIVLGCTSEPKTTNVVESINSELNDIFKKIEEFESSSMDSLYQGKHPKSKWNSVAHEQRIKYSESLQQFIVQLKTIDNKTLNQQEIISKKVMLIRLRNQVDKISFNMHLIPFNAEGGFYNSMGFALSRLPFNSLEDYNSYLNWLPNYISLIQENITNMELGIEKGIVAPKFIVENTIELLQPWRQDEWFKSPFYQPFKQLPKDIAETDRVDLLNRAEKQIKSINSAYHDLHNFFSKTYIKAAKEQPGISFVPNGKAFYENRVKHFTTLNISPDSVHQLGLSEVARIRRAMDDIILQLDFKGDFDEFIAFLRTDEQFYPKSEQELLNYASWLSKKAEAQLPKLFNKLYSLPFTVEPVPDEIAPTYTGGRYVGGSWERQRAGIYWVNTYNLPSRTLYTLPALTLHEAVPGHHLQNALAAENKSNDIPEFRNSYYISAFGEGWGLYSEYLGEEMGMYETPYDLFGRYTYEMWRACRLVVDTGIHYKGWTRKEALDYLSGNTALSMHEVTTEIDRYIGWPGQALSYKVGEIKIKALRSMAEEALGEEFNIGEFHHVILKNGSIPLDVLEEQVKAYVNTKTNS